MSSASPDRTPLARGCLAMIGYTGWAPVCINGATEPKRWNRISLADVTLRVSPERKNALIRHSSRPTAERVACPDCGLMQVLPVLGRRQTAMCRRCDGTLAGPATGRVERPLALASAALLLLLASIV